MYMRFMNSIAMSMTLGALGGGSGSQHHAGLCQEDAAAGPGTSSEEEYEQDYCIVPPSQRGYYAPCLQLRLCVARAAATVDSFQQAGNCH